MRMVVCRIISTCGFATALVVHFGALRILRDAEALGALQSNQVEVLAYVLLRTAGFGGLTLQRVLRRGQRHHALAGLSIRFHSADFWNRHCRLGAAFGTRTFLLILAPAYASMLLMATAAVAFIPFVRWLLVRGAHEEAWNRVAVVEGRG